MGPIWIEFLVCRSKNYRNLFTQHGGTRKLLNLSVHGNNHFLVFTMESPVLLLMANWKFKKSDKRDRRWKDPEKPSDLRGKWVRWARGFWQKSMWIDRSRSSPCSDELLEYECWDDSFWWMPRQSRSRTQFQLYVNSTCRYTIHWADMSSSWQVRRDVTDVKQTSGLTEFKS